MSPRAARRRGSPVAALAIVLLGWISLRAAIVLVGYPAGTILPRAQAKLIGGAGPAVSRQAKPRLLMDGRPPLEPPAAATAMAPPLGLPPAPTAARVLAAIPAQQEFPRTAPVFTANDPSQFSSAPAMRSSAPIPPAGLWQPGLAEQPEEPRASRWSGDAWLLVRGGSDVAVLAPAPPTYGATQAGAVLRYRLAPGSRHRPAAYLRASAALNGSGEREAAAGLSVRPLGAVPVVVAAEGRVTGVPGRTGVRPAVLAYTELPPIALREAARAEVYVQGGYVGGTGATPFVDGQLRVDRRLAQLGALELRAGGGVWGGAQRGAGRLDVGPSASLALAGEAGAARIGLDWRFRVAGAAEPVSGPALTVSAGF